MKMKIVTEQEEPAAQSFLLNWNFPMADDDDVENLVPIPSESKGISDDICDVPSCDNDHFDAEFGLINSLLNRDISITSPKIDFLPEEFAEIRFVENLLYDNSSPRPSEELNLEIADTILESLSPSPILVEDSDSLMKEIDLFLASDDSMPLGIEDDDYDSEEDIRFLEELLNNDSFSLPKNESSNHDHFNDPSPPYPPPEPPDVEICFDFEPDTGVVTNKVVGDISKHNVLMPNL
ncbi:hypothetical protein Tco_0865335 [Tanacetum coccineum]